MDLWVVAAVASAGYIARNWKDLRKGGEVLLESSPARSNGQPDSSSTHLSNVLRPDSPRKTMEKKCIFRRLLGKDNHGENGCEEKVEASCSAYTEEAACDSNCDKDGFERSVNGENNNMIPTSSLLIGLSGGDEFQGGEERDVNDFLIHPSTAQVGTSYGCARDRKILRSRRNGRLIRPLSSLDSCLTAHFYNKHAEFEEYVIDSVASPSKTMRPFIVTDGSNIISKASSDAPVVQKRAGKNNTVYGIPPLPNIKRWKMRRKTKVKAGMERAEMSKKCSKSAGRKHLNSLRGPSHGMLLICFGLSFGMLSSLLANKREMEKLNALLKQAENLVQDLQEELEMKDSLTVKELVAEERVARDMYGDSFPEGPLNTNFSKSKDYDNKEDCKQEADDKTLSKIEAELEAELEMLELNMNSSSLEGKLSNLVELDPDFVADITHGELKADMFGSQAIDKPYADLDGSGTSTPRSANYAVSPRELRLKLHEVLQSRLEERIKELETEVANSQRKIEYMEHENRSYWRELSSSEAGGSSSIHESPVSKELNFAEEPVVLNLAGEALDAYNEAYEEFSKIQEPEEDDLHNSRKSWDELDHVSYWVNNGEENHYPASNETPFHRKGEINSSSQDECGTSRDENDDAMEKLLIKHIVERTRKGSPIVLNAQRALFSTDENVL